jgi:hypothetical protein
MLNKVPIQTIQKGTKLYRVRRNVDSPQTEFSGPRWFIDGSTFVTSLFALWQYRGGTENDKNIRVDEFLVNTNIQLLQITPGKFDMRETENTIHSMDKAFIPNVTRPENSKDLYEGNNEAAAEWIYKHRKRISPPIHGWIENTNFDQIPREFMLVTGDGLTYVGSKSIDEHLSRLLKEDKACSVQ